jgi:hypothetical protein
MATSSHADSRSKGAAPAGTARLALVTLASALFFIILSSAVMSVSNGSLSSSLGTAVRGLQTAVTCYALVMASLMILGGDPGELPERRRAIAVGLAVHGRGSLTSSLTPASVMRRHGGTQHD